VADALPEDAGSCLATNDHSLATKVKG